MLLARSIDLWWMLFLLSVSGTCVFALTRRWSVRRLASAFNRLVEEQRQREAALRAAADAAEATSRKKTELLGRISHEIRTHAHRIRGLLDLEAQKTFTPEQQSEQADIEAARACVASLLGVIDGILDYTSIEGETVAPTSSQLALRETLAAILDPLAARARWKGLELTVEVAPDVPNVLIGDAGKLRQVLAHLVGNAIAFTHQGSVTVRVKTHARDVDAICLRLLVRDTGIGVPPDQHRLIFNAFTRGHPHPTTTPEHGGAGLGLAIAERLVATLRGHLWLESKPGHGSDFRFTAWFRLARDLAPVARNDPSSHWNLAPGARNDPRSQACPLRAASQLEPRG